MVEPGWAQILRDDSPWYAEGFGHCSLKTRHVTLSPLAGGGWTFGNE